MLEQVDRTAGKRLPGPVRAATLHGWGGADRVPAWRWQPAGVVELRTGITSGDPRLRRGAVARGLGRSYGDAAQRWGGVAIDTAALCDLQIDPDSGVATAGAGVTLQQLLAHAAALGFTVPVVPGTQFITLGGAIASDIHGKSHAVDGTFGEHVRALGLLGADGEVRELAPGDPLFAATLGGMGLTGVIVWAAVALRRVPTQTLLVDTDRVGSLQEALAALRAPGGPYRVAWLDLMDPRGPRGVVTRAAFADGADGPLGASGPGGGPEGAVGRVRVTVPPVVPSGLLRPELIRAFNALRFRRAPRQERGAPERFAAHMFPLDGLGAWPRLYGRSGFVQYQLAVGPDRGDTLETVIETLRRYEVPTYLAVLKDFGPANGAPLSFPIEGWTLALDLPRRAPGLAAALDACDELVAQAGGRVYLTKDSRLAPEMLAVMYPRLGEWQAIRDAADPDGLWCSDLAARTGLVRRR